MQTSPTDVKVGGKFAGKSNASTIVFSEEADSEPAVKSPTNKVHDLFRPRFSSLIAGQLFTSSASRFQLILTCRFFSIVCASCDSWTPQFAGKSNKSCISFGDYKEPPVRKY